MAPQASGWYDDPNDPTLMRYWDGVEWSERTMPKIAPGLTHVGEAKPAEERAAASFQRGAPTQNRGEYPAHWGPEEFRTTPSRPDASQSGSAGVIRRIFATLLDRFVVGLVVTLISWPFMSGWMNDLEDYIQQVQDAMSAHTAWPQMPDSVATPPLGYGIALALVLIAYDTLLSMRGRRTLGKRALGLRISADHADAVSLVMSLRRAVVKWSPEIVGLIGAIASASTLLYLVIIVWMLFAPLHRSPQDVFGDTLVERVRNR